MTVRRTRRDDRTTTRKSADAELAGRAERGGLVDPAAREGALGAASERGAARRTARARLRAMGEISLPLVIERRGAGVVAYVLGLPGLLERAPSRKVARQRVVTALRELIAADPVQILEAVEASRREEETLLLEVEAG